MTSQCAIFSRDLPQPLTPELITWIRHEIERAMECHGAEIARVKRHEGAGGVAGAAIDALRLVIERAPFSAVVRDFVEILLIEIVAGNEMRQRTLFHESNELRLIREE